MLLWMIYDTFTYIPFALKQIKKEEIEDHGSKSTGKKPKKKQNSSLSSSLSSSWGMYDEDDTQSSEDEPPRLEEAKFPRPGVYGSLIRCSRHY